VPEWATICANGVKATVDAYDGTVEFYIADRAIPSCVTYGPRLPWAAEAAGANALRPPRPPPLSGGFLRDPGPDVCHVPHGGSQVFYNKEDLWALPRRTLEGRDRDMEPYYTIMRLPGEAKRSSSS